jgi:hypothetical protein
VFAPQVIVKDIGCYPEQPAFKRPTLVGVDSLGQPNKQLAQQIITNILIACQPAKITITPACIYVNYLRKALSTSVLAADYYLS